MEKIKNIPKEKIIYIDESGISTFLYKTHGYAKKGNKIYGKVSGRRYKRENFIAGYLNKKLIAPWCYTGSCDKDFFENWVEKSLISELKPGYTIVLDNASYHKSLKVKNIIKKK